MKDYKYAFRDRIKAKHFYKFLRKHCILDQWLENVREQFPHNKGIPEYNENHDILQLLDTCKDIDYSFMWSETPQGHRYWSNLQVELMKDYNKVTSDIFTMISKY